MSRKWMRIASVAMYVSLVGVVPLSGVATLAAQDTQAPAQQQDGTQQQGPRDGWRGGPRGGERQMEHMTKELNLTTEQQTQVRAIEADTRQQAMAMRQDTTTPEEQKRQKMMALHTTGLAKVRAVLTDEQKVKFDGMAARMQERMERRGGSGAGTGSSTGAGGSASAPAPQQ